LGWSLLLALALLWPAAWNGMPLLFSDSLDYLDTARDLSAPRIRPPLYGLLIAPLVASGGTWAVVLVQAMALALPLLLLVRRLTPHPLAIPLTALAAAAFSTAPFFASWIMPDVLAALVVMATIHAALAKTRLGMLAWVLVATIAAGTHATYPPLLAGLGLVVLAMSFAIRPRPILVGVLLLLAGAAAPLPNVLHNAWFHGQARPALGADGFLAGRLAGDGLLQAHLARICPDAVRPHPLCAAREQIPKDSDLFLWTATGPFWLLRGFDAPDGLWRDLNRAALAEGWPMWLRASIGRAIAQATAVAAGDGPTHGPDFYRQIAPFALELLPGEETAILSARSGREAWGSWGTGPIAPALVGTGLVLCLVGVLRRPRREGVLVLSLLLAALAGNALLVGLGGAVHDRYQARIAWLLPALAAPLLLVPRRRRYFQTISSNAQAQTSSPADSDAGGLSADGTGAISARMMSFPS
jgi:hypothetical protein